MTPFRGFRQHPDDRPMKSNFSPELMKDLETMHGLSATLGIDLDKVIKEMEDEVWDLTQDFDFRELLLGMAATVINEPKNLGDQINSMRAEPIDTSGTAKRKIRSDVINKKFLPGEITS